MLKRLCVFPTGQTRLWSSVSRVHTCRVCVVEETNKTHSERRFFLRNEWNSLADINSLTHLLEKVHLIGERMRENKEWNRGKKFLHFFFKQMKLLKDTSAKFRSISLFFRKFQDHRLAFPAWAALHVFFFFSTQRCVRASQGGGAGQPASSETGTPPMGLLSLTRPIFLRFLF